MSISTAHFILTEGRLKTSKQLRAERRKELRGASLMSELAWWGHEERRAQFVASAIGSEIRRIRKALARLQITVPSEAWFDDARSLRRDQGGTFPPTNDSGEPLMLRAIGETRLYPPTYIVASGHSYHVYLDAQKSGTSEVLTEDGYHGSRVSIRDLVRLDRQRIQDAERDQRAHRHGGKEITNIL